MNGGRNDFGFLRGELNDSRAGFLLESELHTGFYRLLVSQEKSYLKASRACRHEKFGLAAKNGLVDMEGQILAFNYQVGELLGGEEAKESS